MQDDREYLKIDDSLEDSDELMSESQKESKKRLFNTIEKIAIKNNYKNMYQKFSNFPNSSKKTITTNALVMLALTVVFCLCIFYIKYRATLVFVIYPIAMLYFGLNNYVIFYRLKNAYFVTFTGKIVESYVTGTKISNDKHYVIKLVSDEGKEVCFHYYDKKTLNFEQYVTLFIPDDAKIYVSNYGPTISRYIEVVPTSELDARLELFESQNEQNELSVQDYFDR